MQDGLAERYSVAGDVGDRNRGLDGGLSKKVQKELGLLAVPREQRAMDCLGRARPRVRPYLLAALSSLPEHQGSNEKSRTVVQRLRSFCAGWVDRFRGLKTDLAVRAVTKWFVR